MVVVPDKIMSPYIFVCVKEIFISYRTVSQNYGKNMYPGVRVVRDDSSNRPVKYNVVDIL